MMKAVVAAIIAAVILASLFEWSVRCPHCGKHYYGMKAWKAFFLGCDECGGW